MRKIILHSPAIDRHGKRRDAGEELTSGAVDNDDSDITTDAAQILLDGGRAVTVTEAAQEADGEPIEPEAVEQPMGSTKSPRKARP